MSEIERLEQENTELSEELSAAYSALMRTRERLEEAEAHTRHVERRVDDLETFLGYALEGFAQADDQEERLEALNAGDCEAVPTLQRARFDYRGPAPE